MILLILLPSSVINVGLGIFIGGGPWLWMSLGGGIWGGLRGGLRY